MCALTRIMIVIWKAIDQSRLVYADWKNHSESDNYTVSDDTTHHLNVYYTICTRTHARAERTRLHIRVCGTHQFKAISIDIFI